MNLSTKKSSKNCNELEGKHVTRSMLLCILGLTLLASLFYAESVALGFGETYTFKIEWGGYGTEYGQLNNPYDVAVPGSGNVYVTDTYNHRIQKFNAEGVFLGTWGGYGTSAGQLNYSMGIDIDEAGNTRTYSRSIRSWCRVLLADSHEQKNLLILRRLRLAALVSKYRQGCRFSLGRFSVCRRL